MAALGVASAHAEHGGGGAAPSASHSGPSGLFDARSDGDGGGGGEASAQVSEQTLSAVRPAAVGAAVDAAALLACVGRLVVTDFAVTDDRGAPQVRRPRSLRATRWALVLSHATAAAGRAALRRRAHAVPVGHMRRPAQRQAPDGAPFSLAAACSDPQPSHQRLLPLLLRRAQVSLGEWRLVPPAGAGEAAVLAMGAKRGRWYTLEAPTQAYAPLFTALRQRRLSSQPTPPGFSSDSGGGSPLPALRPPPREAPPPPAVAVVAIVDAAAPPPQAAEPALPGFSDDDAAGGGDGAESEDESDDDEAVVLPPFLAAEAPPAPAAAAAEPEHSNLDGFGDDDDDDEAVVLPPFLAAEAPPAPAAAPAEDHSGLDGFGDDDDDDDDGADMMPPFLVAEAPPAAAADEVEHSGLDVLGGDDMDDDEPLPGLKPPPPAGAGGSSGAAGGSSAASAAAPRPAAAPLPAQPSPDDTLPPGFEDSDSGEAPAPAAQAAAAEEVEHSDLEAMATGSDDDGDGDAAAAGGGGDEPELSDVDVLRASSSSSSDDGAGQLPPGLTGAAEPEEDNDILGLDSEDEAGGVGAGAAASSTITEPPAAANAGAAMRDDATTAHPVPMDEDFGGDAGGDGDDDAALAAEAAEALEERWQANDTQCGLCDDGGELLLCEGPCMRSFCFDCMKKKLHMGPAELDALGASTQPWLCPACETGRHRCFQCLEEGVASEAQEKTAIAAGSRLRRVHKCSVFECSRFYHPACAIAAAAGAKHGTAPPRALPFAPLPPTGFTCPQHECRQCKGGTGLPARGPLVRCRRCPAAFHVACMAAAGLDTDPKVRPQRVWLSVADGENPPAALVDTSLVYCLAHPMGKDDQVPARGRDEVFPEPLLHEAAGIIATRECKSQKCFGCGIFVKGKRPAAEEWPDEFFGRGAAGCGELRGKGLDNARRWLAAAAASAPSVAAHSAALGSGGDCYKARARRTIGMDRLGEMETTSRAAMRARAQGDAAAAAALLSARLLSEFRASHLSLRVANAPFLFSTKYTSHGRHFTVPARLAQAAARAALFMRHGDTVVDFSAGANDWLPAVAQRAAAAGLRGLTFRGFDIFPAACPFGFTEKDWFAVTRADVGGASGDRLVVGLNPPFGTDGALAAKFVAHAVAVLQPRLLILIVPRETPLPGGYVELERNYRLAEGHAFYLPGSLDPATQNPVEDWNKQTPPFIIMCRADAAKSNANPAKLLESAWRLRPDT
jgi:hypothetical protein